MCCMSACGIVSSSKFSNIIITLSSLGGVLVVTEIFTQLSSVDKNKSCVFSKVMNFIGSRRETLEVSRVVTSPSV